MSNLGRYDWVYCYLKNGRLVTWDGVECNPTWPSFKSFSEAEKWLEGKDIRVTIVS